MTVEGSHHAEHTGPSGSDVLIAMLGAAVIAGLVWALVFGALAGVAFGLEFFKVTLPQVAADGLQAATRILPVLAAIPAAWLSYKFILKLP